MAFGKRMKGLGAVPVVAVVLLIAAVAAYFLLKRTQLILVVQLPST